MGIKEQIAMYESIKSIIMDTEASIAKKYKECLDNNWMDEYTHYSTHAKLQALLDVLDRITE